MKGATSGRVGKDHIFGTVTQVSHGETSGGTSGGNRGKRECRSSQAGLVDHVLETWPRMQPLQAQEWGASFSEQMMGSYSLTHSK